MDQPHNHHSSIWPRLLPLGSAAALATVAIGSAVSAAPPDPNPLLQCVPIECAAAYIGVPTTDLSAAVVNETIRTGLPGMMIVIDQLDDAEQAKLSATDSTNSARKALARYSITATHDALRDLLLAYAVGGLISPPGAP